MPVIAMRGAIDRRQFADLYRRHISSRRIETNLNEHLQSLVRTELENAEHRLCNSCADRREQFGFYAATRRRRVPARTGVRRARIWRQRTALGDRVLQTCVQQREPERDGRPFRFSKLLRRPGVLPAALSPNRRLQLLHHDGKGPRHEPPSLLGIV